MRSSVVIVFLLSVVTCTQAQSQVNTFEKSAYKGSNSDRIIVRNTFFWPTGDVYGDKLEIPQGIVVKYISDCDDEFAEVGIYADDKPLEYGRVRKADLQTTGKDTWLKVKAYGRTGWFYVDDG